MKVIIDEYTKTKDNIYLEIILKYVNAEYELTRLISLGGNRIRGASGDFKNYLVQLVFQE